MKSIKQEADGEKSIEMMNVKFHVSNWNFFSV